MAGEICADFTRIFFNKGGKGTIFLKDKVTYTSTIYFFLTNFSEIVTFINCFRCFEVKFLYFSLEISDIIKWQKFCYIGRAGRKILERVSNIALPVKHVNKKKIYTVLHMKK